MATPDTLCLGCVLDRLVEARLLGSQRRYAEAATILDERLPTLLSPTEAYFQVELAGALQHLAEPDRLAETCGRLSRVWHGADPDQKRLVSEVCRGQLQPPDA